MVDQINAIFNGPISSVSNQTWDRVGGDFPMVNATEMKDFGFIISDLVLEQVLKEPSGCDYIMFTNADNLYTEKFLPLTLSAFVAGVDAVAVHFLSRYNFTMDTVIFMNKMGCGPKRTGELQTFSPQFSTQCIDLGAVVFTKDIIKKTNERFILNDLRYKNQSEYAHLVHAYRDGNFLRNLREVHHAKMNIIDPVLFVHQ